MRRRAAECAARDGVEVVDLAIGAPIDPTPDVVQRALAAAADAPGYPLTVGRADLRAAFAGWIARNHGVHVDPAAVLPTIGSKELIGSLALHLDVAAGEVVALPPLAYPTYAVGAALVGARVLLADDAATLAAADPAPRLIWVNSPSNPTGRVLGVDALRELVRVCRERGTIVVSDECYLDLGWESTPVSALHPDVCGLTHDGVLALHSLSKRSNLAGYRVGFVAGDPALVAELASVRRNLGLQLPAPQQAAAIAALDDDEHVAAQRARYAARRDVLRPAVEAAGLRVEHSEAGLYLWATRGEPAADTQARLAERGIVAVSGAEYGEAGGAHVRFALTATDDAVARAAARLRAEVPA